MPVDRARYGARQAALLRSLLAGQAPPEGFLDGDAAAASRSLIAKRARALAKSWPALAISLGSRFDAAFWDFARVTPPPSAGEGLADGLAFASQLDRAELTNDARAELLLARAAFRLREGEVAPRRAPFVGACWLDDPARVLIVVHLPGFGQRHAAVRLGRNRS